MIISLKNTSNGLVKDVNLGFSWTTFFFGAFVPLFRSDFKWAIIMFLLGSITFGISGFIFPFIYNKIYIKEMIEKGYKPIDNYGENKLKDLGISFLQTH